MYFNIDASLWFPITWHGVTARTGVVPCSPALLGRSVHDRAGFVTHGPASRHRPAWDAGETLVRAPPTALVERGRVPDHYGTCECIPMRSWGTKGAQFLADCSSVQRTK